MNVRQRTLRRIASMLFLGAVLAGCASGPDSPSPELRQRLEAARTRSDHEALAAHYEREGAAARAVAARHRTMAAAYQTWLANDPGAASMVTHCIAIAQRQEGIAAEYEGMAEGHQAVANRTQP